MAKHIKTVEDIVKAYLKKHCYDGLYNPDDECGCFASDLFPCGSGHGCRPGYACEDEDGELIVGLGE